MRICNNKGVNVADTTFTFLFWDFSDNNEINAILGMCARDNKFYLSTYTATYEFIFSGGDVTDKNNWEYNLLIIMKKMF